MKLHRQNGSAQRRHFILAMRAEPTRHHRRRAPAGPALAFAVLVFASCTTVQTAFDYLQAEEAFESLQAAELDLVKSTIDQPERREQFVELLAERDRLMDRYAERVKAHREVIASLNANYYSRREDFEAQLDAFNRVREEAQVELIELTARMKQTTTADEWEVIATFQSKKLSLRKLAFRDRTDGD